ncbi:hypothetical protein [Rufibacter ruber]|uniref:HD domain-containing protein n=1 Tax=Rufibacter ruber TaxID=1783499 RepID=UPI00082DF59D|nr:hypothetical protein [Rufibacter ruber]
MTPALYPVWQDLLLNFTQEETRIQQLWAELEAAYSGKNRHYHTLHHIQSMLQLAETHQVRAQGPLLLKLAIFYHDAVYKTTRNDNEEKSAQLACQRMKGLGLPPADLDQLGHMILATKQHQRQPQPDTNLLLDLDLSILGSGWLTYWEYTQLIRKEYSVYPDVLYKPGRKKVLQHFLDQEQIFKTGHFTTLFEAQAKENLRRELDILAR